MKERPALAPGRGPEPIGPALPGRGIEGLQGKQRRGLGEERRVRGRDYRSDLACTDLPPDRGVRNALEIRAHGLPELTRGIRGQPCLDGLVRDLVQELCIQRAELGGIEV